MCREHAEYILSYAEILFDERRYRSPKPDSAFKFTEWARDVRLPEDLPASGQTNLVLPWKSLKTRFRRRDVLEGYRLQYMDTFLWQDPIGAYGCSGRDVPDFVIRHFRLDTASMVT